MIMFSGSNQRVKSVSSYFFTGFLLLASTLASGPLWACEAHDKQCLPSIQKKPLTVAEIRQGIEKKHPATFCELSRAYFSARDNAQALKFYYVCQIRWRIYLLTEGDQEPGGEVAAFGAINYMMDRAVTMVGESDIDQWADQVEAAIKWHSSNPSLFQDFSLYRETETTVLAQYRQHALDIRDAQ